MHSIQCFYYFPGTSRIGKYFSPLRTIRRNEHESLILLWMPLEHAGILADRTRERDAPLVLGILQRHMKTFCVFVHQFMIWRLYSVRRLILLRILKYVRYNVHSFPVLRMTKTVTATQARKDLFKLLRQAKTPGHFVTITIAGLPSVTMMSFDEFEGWQETCDIQSDPKLLRSLKSGLKDMKAGRVLTLAEVERSLKR